MPVRGHVGSDYERLRPEFRVIQNPWAPSERVMLVPSISPDVALIHAIAATEDGMLAAIPAGGVLLAHFTHAPRATVIIINHPDYWPFRGGSKEFYDFAQRGKLDLFFLSGGQIDRHGNLNLITVGDHERPDVRFPGGAGAAMLYYLPHRVVVFRADHSPRIFVERVDTVTSPGSTPPDVVRPGSPWKTVTPLCVFRYDRGSAALVVESLHPGVTREELGRRTGFALAYRPDGGV